MIFRKGQKISATIYRGANLVEATATKEFTEKLIAEERIIGGNPRDDRPVPLSIKPTTIDFKIEKELDPDVALVYDVIMGGIVQ